MYETDWRGTFLIGLIASGHPGYRLDFMASRNRAQSIGGAQ